MFAYHRRQVNSDADAADLTQDTFRRVWKSLPHYREASSVGTWIHRIAYCTWIDWLRGREATEPVGNRINGLNMSTAGRGLWVRVLPTGEAEANSVN